MEGIKHVIFDLGGVILNIDNRKTEAAFVALGVKDFGKYFGHGFAASFFKDYELGKITDKQFITELKKMAGLSVSDGVVINAWNALLQDFPPERINLLKQLSKTYRLFLFSNTNALHLQALREIYIATFGSGSLEDLFEKTYYSHIMGLRKPDRQSYEYILRENKLDHTQTLFVDDALINIQGAESAGLHGYFVAPGTTIMDIPW